MERDEDLDAQAPVSAGPRARVGSSAPRARTRTPRRQKVAKSADDDGEPEPPRLSAEQCAEAA
jgi:hypothetical protein